jgi:hypothetical protein
MTAAEIRYLKKQGLPVPKPEIKPYTPPEIKTRPFRQSGLLGVCLALGAMGGV